jgi:hypothetical protein
VVLWREVKAGDKFGSYTAKTTSTPKSKGTFMLIH